jgi:predicted AlkP superfamily phosphohydrolase/phosphomutase
MMLRRRITLSALLLAAAATASIVSCGGNRPTHPKVVVLGFDGMDPRLCERLMDEGRLPNLARMRASGGYRPLGTSIPPQSPVAWSNFISGAGPGVHGIFDFIHRDPKRQYYPKYSAAETIEGDDGWNIGRHKLPLTFWPFSQNPTQTLLTRHGTPFWSYLDAAGIPVQIYDIPSNYPPSRSEHGHMCCLSGMGVPDLLGTPGTYQYFSSDTLVPVEGDGGMRRPIFFKGGVATVTLVGPDNTALTKPVHSEAKLQIRRHETEPAVRIDWQGNTVVLREGEWSDWCKLDFRLEMPPFMPDAHVSGICRFYVQQVRPDFRLYVTPINIDPSDPGEQRVSEPPSFVTDISKDLGLFFTSGFQEDHKARTNGVFDDQQYLEQAGYVLGERRNLFDYALEHYRDGLLFFYFSSTDLQAHMFWWDGDEPHPVRTPEQAHRYNKVIEDLYIDMDRVVGEVDSRVGDDAAILVMSDHGFCNFSRQFNLNTWLRDNGYIQPSTCRNLATAGRGRPVDWTRTRAYGLGLNGLYLNLKERERDGIVDPSQRDALLDEISQRLLAVRDPANGHPVIARVYRSDEVYAGPHAADAPDLVVGYNRGYRASWATTLGDMPDEVIANNDSAWSADHCIAAEEVPGVLFSNRPIPGGSPSLVDVAPTVLELFKLDRPASMTGRSVFGPQQSASAPGPDRRNARAENQD